MIPKGSGELSSNDSGSQYGVRLDSRTKTEYFMTKDGEVEKVTEYWVDGNGKISERVTYNLSWPKSGTGSIGNDHVESEVITGKVPNPMESEVTTADENPFDERFGTGEDFYSGAVSTEIEDGAGRVNYSSTSGGANTATTFAKHNCEDVEGKWVAFVAEIKCNGLTVPAQSGGICVSRICSEDDAYKFTEDMIESLTEGASEFTNCEFEIRSSGSLLLPGSMVLVTSAIVLAWSSL